MADGTVMFRSSVAAFYPQPSYLFYRVGRFHCGGFINVFLPAPPLGSEIKKVVHWMAEILFATEIAFRGLDRCMPEQKLNLLQLATVTVINERVDAKNQRVSAVKIVGEFPRSTAGKTLKRILREPYWVGRNRNT